MVMDSTVPNMNTRNLPILSALADQRADEDGAQSGDQVHGRQVMQVDAEIG
jgi:hypothetical protein